MNKFHQSNGMVWWTCPGCKHAHGMRVVDAKTLRGVGYLGGDNRWTWNGSLDKPTITPSINHPGICHFFIRDGRVEFCSDSTHELAGQTVDLPDWD